MKYLVGFIEQSDWKQYQENWYDYQQYLAQYEDYRKEEFKELREALLIQTGEELTLAQYNRNYPYKADEAPEAPIEHNEFCNSKESAQEFAFLKNLEGCRTRIFYSPGQDDDGDELWEEI